MASALLASGNEPYWLERKDFMKNSVSNPNPRAVPDFYTGEPSARFRAVDQEAPTQTAADAVSDDSSTFGKKAGCGLVRRWGSGGGIGGNYVCFDVATYSKVELRELKMRLAAELERVRDLLCRIEARERDIRFSGRSGGLGEWRKHFDGGGRDVTSAAVFPFDSLPSRSSDLFLASGDPKHHAPALESDKNQSAMMKKCGQILSKLMKKKMSIWFNSPVDAVGMGLHDYFQIVKNPMDLGTVKMKLGNNLYPSPVEFAEDMRLTFNNALLYNPQGHEVHKLADQFLRQFEILFVPAFQKYEKQRISLEQRERLMLSARSRVPSTMATARPDDPTPAMLAEAIPKAAPQRVRAPPLLFLDPALETPPVHGRFLLQQQPNGARAAEGKLPKPKAKDPNKRPMSLEEKQKLSDGLQSLPPEKMSNVLHIVKRRDVDAMQRGDEIELDLNVLDTDTLWELDRFLYNCKKMMSKIRRQEAIARSLGSASGVHSVSAPTEAGNGQSPMAIDAAGASPTTTTTTDPGKKGSSGVTAVEEDVDIGDDLPAMNYPSVEIEKNNSGRENSSSSSSDSDSLSSGSDTDSDETDEDDGGGESTKN